MFTGLDLFKEKYSKEDQSEYLPASIGRQTRNLQVYSRHLKQEITRFVLHRYCSAFVKHNLAAQTCFKDLTVNALIYMNITEYVNAEAVISL